MKYERTSSATQKKWHEERRSTVRIPVDQIVAYSLNGSNPIVATVCELSNTSFCMIASGSIAIGTIVTIAFPFGALLSKRGVSRIHVFEGRIVQASTRGVQFRYGIDLIENLQNVDDLRCTILQLSLRRTARGLKARAASPASNMQQSVKP